MRWVVVTSVLVVMLGGLGLLSLAGEAAEAQRPLEAATVTPFPLYLPHLGVAFVWPTPTLPPPIIADPYTGTICPVASGAYTCWPSTRFTLSRGPGEACGAAMSPVFYLVSDSVNLELYQGRPVLLRGDRQDSPGCVPLLRVTNLQPAAP